MEDSEDLLRRKVTIREESKEERETIAAIGPTEYADPMVSGFIPTSPIYGPIVTYHAPQTKNWRNIIAESCVPMIPPSR